MRLDLHWPLEGDPGLAQPEGRHRAQTSSQSPVKSSLEAHKRPCCEVFMLDRVFAFAKKLCNLQYQNLQALHLQHLDVLLPKS